MKVFKGLMAISLLLGLSTACTGDEEPAETDETDKKETLRECVKGETVAIGDKSYTLAFDGLQILNANPNLTAGGFQSFTSDTCEWTYGDNLLNIFQTGVTDINNGWDEEHVIPSTGYVDATADTPPLDALSLAISHVDTIGELTGDDKTLFNSDDDGGLTYALRIYDASGALADCIAWGHDVPGMFAGNVPGNNSDGPTNVSQIASDKCATLGR